MICGEYIKGEGFFEYIEKRYSPETFSFAGEPQFTQIETLLTTTFPFAVPVPELPGLPSVALSPVGDFPFSHLQEFSQPFSQGRFPYNGETPSNNKIRNIILLILFGIAAPSDSIMVFLIRKDEILQKDFLHPTDLYTKHLLLRHSAKKI